MSTTIPIQDLDPSVSPPSDRTIRAVVTLSWPYSSSTRQCALLLSERDFRLRARGGQIRVKFSGPAARAVAHGKLGIGDEVVLELGAGEWASGAAVHVPGKSVGELHFGRGVQLRIQKEGTDDVEVNVADDAVDEVEQEVPQVESTPVKRTSPTTTFRSSIGGLPGSAAIYSSPAYMRKAAKFSYLDGISRLFEDEWDNQDLPRKKARTSMGDVKSWKVVDRTPSPEPSSPSIVDVVEEEMLDASQVEVTNARDTTVEDMPVVTSITDREPIAEILSARSSPTPAPIQQNLRPASPASVTAPLLSPLELLANEALEGQLPVATQATVTTSTFPRLHLPSASPTPQPSEPEPLEEQAFDPPTPRLVPLASTALLSTTPQISPLATRDAFAAETTDDRGQGVEVEDFEAALPSDDPSQREPVILTSPNKATESLLDQLKSTTGESEPATEPILPEEDASVDILNQWENDDLVEEDAFSDDEADEALSAHENDAELMPEDDAEDVFDADELEGEEPSDDESDEDPDLHRLPAQQWLEESATEKDSDSEEQVVLEDQMDIEMTTEPQVSTSAQAMSQQPSFAPASTLLNAAETPAKVVQQQPVASEERFTTTPPKKPFFGLDGAVSPMEQVKVTTPAAKPTDTPKRTPQSAHDKVMKRTFSSLFGLKATPSPEKEDPPTDEVTTSATVITEQVDQHVPATNATQTEQLIEINDSLSTQRVVAHASSDAAVEVDMTENPSSPNNKSPEQNVVMQDMHDMMVTAGESLDQMAQETQKEDAQLEPALSARQQSPELIHLDSSSDAEADQPELQPSVPAPMPQKRLVIHETEYDASEMVDSDHAENIATDIREDPVESALPETTVPHMEVQYNEHEDLEVERHLSVEDQEDIQAPTASNTDVDVEQEAVLPEKLSQPDQDALDSLERPSSLSPTPKSPTVGVEKSTSVDIELQKPSQHEREFPDPADGNVSSSGDEASQDHFEQLQPAASTQRSNSGSEAATPANLIIAQSEAQVATALQGDDIEMLDDERQESELLQASFQSQLSQGMDLDSTPTVSERLTKAEDEVEVVDLAREDDVDMLDNQHREAESSQASFQSQVLQESIEAQKPVALDNNSRPTSRDTVEDFSPVALGSMTQRIVDLVSDDSATVRLQELQSEDHDIDIERADEETLEVPSTTELVEEEQLERTPTRTRKVQAVEVEFSPAQLRMISPAEVTPTTQAQEPTPQATFNDDAQNLHVTDQEIVAMKEIEGLSASDAQALESQLQVTEAVGEEGSSALSPELFDITGNKDEQAYLTLPLSPSATQATKSMNQLPHANNAGADMPPTPATSQLQSSVQPDTSLAIPEPLENLTDMSQTQMQNDVPAELLESHDAPETLQSQLLEKDATSMPPPEQSLPPKTPAKRSLRSRLSNVPDVISAWFSPKRSSIVAQEPEERAVVETPTAIKVSATETPRTSKRRASGLSTAHAYFTRLASLGQYVNPSSQQAGTVDILAVVADFAKEPERAKGGPKDYYTIFRVTDPSMSGSANVRVEVFRPWKAVLPAADVGDVVLLRAFVVKSKKRQAYLLSTDTSAWCVWRFAEYSKTTARGGSGTNDGEKPARARRMSHSEVREEVKGPPVEYGMAEKEQARKLRDWWVEAHGETQGGSSKEHVDEGQDEEAEVIEL